MTYQRNTNSLAQQMFATIGGLARVRSIRDALVEWRGTMPVALTLMTSVVLYRISLLYSTLSFAQAVKTLQPLFAALLSTLLLRERTSPRRMLSLLLLLAGVTVATTTELSFSLLGFACTVGACFAQALQAVLSKSLLVHNHIGPDDLFAVTALCTTVLLLPLWMAIDAPSLAAGEPPHLLGSGTIPLLLLNGVSNFLTQQLSFTVLCTVVSPVSAAVVTTFKRIITIAAAVFWFGTSMTLANVFGVSLALLGVTLFQEQHRTPEAGSPDMRRMHMPLSLALSPRRRDGEVSRALCRAV